MRTSVSTSVHGNVLCAFFSAASSEEIHFSAVEIKQLSFLRELVGSWQSHDAYIEVVNSAVSL